jgi:hypothetical protein
MEKGPEFVVSLEALYPVPESNRESRSTRMIQHVRRNLARLLPSASETSIPLSAVVQTAIASIFFVTLRLSFPLVTGVALTCVWHPIEVPAQLLGLLTATVLADRSAVVYLRIRRS